MRTMTLLAVVGLVVLIFAGCLLWPCMDGPVSDDTGPRFLSRMNLKQIALAMQAYHDVHKTLPPAVIRDKDGRPLYSWRVALLPFLDQHALYQRFKLEEPWDSPHNRNLLEPTPSLYAISWPATPPGMTPYQVCTGPGTAFERDGLSLKNDFPDGPDQTILVVESSEPVLWTKPADLVYDPNRALPPLGVGLGRPIRLLCYEVGQQPGFTVAFASGAVRFLPTTVDEETMRALITRNGAQKVDWSKTEWQ
jgi:Protein of unknown function (DUF1559)